MTNFYSESLCCPFCESEYLHQQAYRIWSTNEDKQSDCVTIFDEYQNLRVEKTLNEENPSSRCRGAISIEFSCEHCEKISTFTILQHKGCTYLGFK
jgi:hypothetical protein|tara:strand:+ start:40 stop:327 length:288 start_codon:yes stop_codon:yes gene_type:complete